MDWRNMMADERPPRLLTVVQVRALLGVGTTTVYKLINEGHLELLKIGSASRVTGASLSEFIKGLPRKEIRAAQLKRTMAEEVDTVA
jgi:excisionase family DNA binding protein